MSMYSASDIFAERIKARKENKDLIYKCFWCEADINLNDKRSPNTFRGELSYREFLISGLCQKCQDKSFNKKEVD